MTDERPTEGSKRRTTSEGRARDAAAREAQPGTQGAQRGTAQTPDRAPQAPHEEDQEIARAAEDEHRPPQDSVDETDPDDQILAGESQHSAREAGWRGPAHGQRAPVGPFVREPLSPPAAGADLDQEKLESATSGEAYDDPRQRWPSDDPEEASAEREAWEHEEATGVWSREDMEALEREIEEDEAQSKPPSERAEPRRGVGRGHNR